MDERSRLGCRRKKTITRPLEPEKADTRVFTKRGGAGDTLLSALRHDFARVHHVKPEASRQQSSEIYVVARGFRRIAS